MGQSVREELEPEPALEAPGAAVAAQPRTSAAPRRRDLIIGAACAIAAGAAYGLKPRRQMSLLGAARLEDALPRAWPGWSSQDVSDLVQPREPESLAARIYGQTVGRIYVDAASGFQIMMLAAFGDTQSRDLQLHRPELCYPAVGFSVRDSAPAPVKLPGGSILPARRLLAEAPGRREAIVYWSRLGEYLPVTGMEQRVDVLRTAIAGYVADGVLMRFSAVGADEAGNFARLMRFIPALLLATAPQQRPALIGNRLSSELGERTAS